MRLQHGGVLVGDDAVVNAVQVKYRHLDAGQERRYVDTAQRCNSIFQQDTVQLLGHVQRQRLGLGEVLVLDLVYVQAKLPERADRKHLLGNVIRHVSQFSQGRPDESRRQYRRPDQFGPMRHQCECHRSGK